MLLILSMMLRARNHRARQSRAAANKSWQLTAQRFAHARRGTHVAMAVNYAAAPRGCCAPRGSEAPLQRALRRAKRLAARRPSRQATCHAARV